MKQNSRRVIQTRHISAWAGLGLLSWVSTARAAYPLVVDDAGVHLPGKVDMDFFTDALRTSTSETVAANFFGTVGLCPRLEGWVGLGYGWTRDRSPDDAPTTDGLLDLNIGLKVSIVPEDAGRFAFALSTNVKLPTADEDLDLGTGLTDWGITAIGTRSWGDFSLNLNAGFGWTAVGDRPEREGDAWFTGVALRWQTSERLMLFAETFGILLTDGDTEPVGTVRVGAQLEFWSDALIGGAIGTGYGSEAPELLGTIGLTVRF
jgi:hypothetical protein